MKGFTLIELMVTIAVAAVLLGIAVPSFQDMLERNRVAAQTNEVLGDLQMKDNISMPLVSILQPFVLIFL